MGADYPEHDHERIVDMAPLPALCLPLGRRLEPLAVQMPKIAALLRPTGKDGYLWIGKRKRDERKRLERLSRTVSAVSDSPG